MSTLPVTFFVHGEGDPAALARLDLERDWREYVRGERAWVVQTYLRLTHRGYPATLADQAPDEGLVVFHAKQRRQVAAACRGKKNLLLVGVRADNREPHLADFEVVQNGRWADGRRRFCIPFWPQAGLVPRDPSRGTTVRHLAFKGFSANLASGFLSPEWRSFVAEHSFTWEKDMVAYAGSATEEHRLAWNDYSRVDLIVALRPPDRRLHTGKPATKLYNAWAAGVPAILGPEFAYRELRRSPLDYLEAASVAEAREAVLRLAGDSGLYQAMVDHGRSRAPEMSFDATTERWACLLYEELPRQAERARRHLLRRFPLPVRAGLRRLARLAAFEPAR